MIHDGGQTVNARAAVLCFVRRYITDRDDSPSLGEIADALRSTKPAVSRVLASLERDGEIIWLDAGPGRKRRIIMPEQQARAVSILRALGWNVNGDMRQVSRAPVTDWELFAPPALKHIG